MGNRRHKKASKSVLERSTVESEEKKTEDPINTDPTKKPSISNDEDTTGDTAEVSEKTNSKSDVSAATKDVSEDDDNYLPNEPEKSCVNKSKDIDQESLGVELAKNINGSIILDEIDEESKENELDVDNVKNIENNSNGDTEDLQQVPVLRLVAIEKLLKPDFMQEEETIKESTSAKSKTLTKLAKSSSRSRKSISYVEISDSSENETIESINSSSENGESSKKLSGTSRKSCDLSSKENNSTNNILSDGKSKHDFNNPTIISPSKAKMVKSFTLNIEKMPNNVNKLMKVYKVKDKKNHDELTNSEPIDIWSESDDFENMISTSKIEKKSSDAESSKTNSNCEKEESTRSTRFNKASCKEELLNESNINKKPNNKGSTKLSCKTKSDSLEPTKRTTKNSEKRSSSSTSSRINTEEDAAKEESSAVIENNTSKRSLKNRQTNIKNEPIEVSVDKDDEDEDDSDNDNDNDNDKDKESSDEILTIEKESIVPEKRNKKKSPQKKFSNESEDSDNNSSSNEKVQKTKEVSDNLSSNSADEEISQDEPSPLLETRMRSREKYDKNADFISLKQTIALRKKKKIEDMVPKMKSKSNQSTDNASKFKIPLKTKAKEKNEQETTPKTENTEITQTNAKKNTVVNNPNADVKKEQITKDNDSIVNSKFKKSYNPKCFFLFVQRFHCPGQLLSSKFNLNSN